MKLHLTPRQHELLYSDTYANRPEDEEGTTLDKGEVWGGIQGQQLRAELRAGKHVTITPFLISEIKEFADRDADTNERMIYTRLLRKIQGPEYDQTQFSAKDIDTLRYVLANQK